MLLFPTSALNKQTNPSKPCPVWVPPASIYACIYLTSLAQGTHYSLKPLSESKGISGAMIRWSYLYSESTDARVLRTYGRCKLHFQESEQILVRIPRNAATRRTDPLAQPLYSYNSQRDTVYKYTTELDVNLVGQMDIWKQYKKNTFKKLYFISMISDICITCASSLH